MEGKKFWIITGTCLFILLSPFIFFNSGSMGCYQRQIDKDPKSPSSRNWQLRLAAIYYHSLRLREAAKSYRTFIDRYPKDPERPMALEREAMCWHDLDMRAEAIVVWKQLAREYPDSPQGVKAIEWMRRWYNIYYTP